MKKQIQILMIAMIAAVCSAQESGSVATAPMTSAQTEALADESMRLYAAGDFAAANQGFQSVLRSKPDHALARYFQQKIDSRMRRDAEENALADVDQNWNGMILRNYALSEESVEKLDLANAEQSTEVSGLFDPIPFEQGAYATYWPNNKKIVVLNTPENVREMETLLAALEMPMDGKDGQIEIQTRFIEFAEGALEELGFEWSDVEDGRARGLVEDWQIKDGENLFAESLRGSDDVFTQPGSIYNESRAGAGDWTARRLRDGFSEDAGTLLIEDVGADLNLLIRALDQTSGADVLSAPRIVTRAGKQATIQVGQTHFFPDVFEVGGSEGNIVHVDYQDFEEKLMGVELSVTPNLIESDLIEMNLNPKITELLGWRGYEVAPADSAYTYFQYRIGETFEHDAVVARLPIFRRREVQTSVTIKDGSTIGMGGLISENTESFSDRVPVLGSIPLIGRLFRSEGERTVKRNLMIFVTARKVAPNGRMIGEQAVN